MIEFVLTYLPIIVAPFLAGWAIYTHLRIGRLELKKIESQHDFGTRAVAFENRLDIYREFLSSLEEVEANSPWSDLQKDRRRYLMDADLTPKDVIKLHTDSWLNDHDFISVARSRLLQLKLVGSASTLEAADQFRTSINAEAQILEDLIEAAHGGKVHVNSEMIPYETAAELRKDRTDELLTQLRADLDFDNLLAKG